MTRRGQGDILLSLSIPSPLNEEAHSCIQLHWWTDRPTQKNSTDCHSTNNSLLQPPLGPAKKKILLMSLRQNRMVSSQMAPHKLIFSWFKMNIFPCIKKAHILNKTSPLQTRLQQGQLGTAGHLRNSVSSLDQWNGENSHF